MKDLFNPEDFQELDLYGCAGAACEYANTKLNAEIEKWPVVLGNRDGEWTEAPDYNELYIKTAHLAFIEEIEPKECEHKRVIVPEGWPYKNSEPVVCFECRKDLSIKWVLSK